ncbi:MAG: PQQ-binding-like beta-propeller repeat protein [Deltaproteobacteria bacterium]|nr:PQQ-binding-like beta-propeller repeat protein [Deltaproteobacteria bacterium]
MKKLSLLAALILFGCGGLPVAGGGKPAPVASWFMEGGDAGRSGRGAPGQSGSLSSGHATALVDQPGYQPEEYATPVIAGPVAYVGHAGRAFQAVLWRTGEVLWTFRTRGRVFSTAALAADRLFFGDDQGDVIALTTEGKEVWRFRVQYPVVASPVAAAGRVFVPCSDQNIYCLDAATGKPLWQHGRKLPRRSSIWRGLGLAWGGGRLYAGFADGSVTALDPDIGRVLWKVELAKEGLFSDVVAGPSFRDGRVYVGTLRGPAACLEAETGKEVWRQEVEAASGFAVGDELVYAGTAGGSVVALSKSDGAKVWEVLLDGGVSTPPTLAGDALLAGASRGSLYLIDARTGEVRRKHSSGSGQRGQPATFEEGVAFLSNAGVLHWLR